MKDILVHYNYWICLAAVLLIAVLLAFSLKHFLRDLKQVRATTWVLVGALLVISFFLRLELVPHTHYVYFDEFFHINIAQNMAHSQEFCYCKAGSIDDCLDCELPQWPPGHYFLLSILFGIFGHGEAVAFNFNAVIGSLSVLAVFVAGLLISGERTGVLMSFLLTLHPLHLKYSGNSSLEIASLFFIIMAVLSLSLYIKTGRLVVYLLTLSIAAYASLIRIENVILAPLCVLLVWLKREEIGPGYDIKWLAGLAILFMALPLLEANVLAGQYYAFDQGYGVIVPNLRFWFENGLQPVSITLLALLGTVVLYRENKLYLFWFAAFFTGFFILIFLMKRNANHYDLQRFNHQMLLPVLFFAASGAGHFIKRFELTSMKTATAVLFSILLFNIYGNRHLVEMPFRDIQAKEYELLLSAKEFIKPEDVVYTAMPAVIISTMGNTSYPLEALTSVEDGTGNIRNNVILFRDVCYYFTIFSDAFAEIEKRYALIPLKEIIVDDKTIGFYRLKNKVD